jgi:hypothetical protein
LFEKQQLVRRGICSLSPFVSSLHRNQSIYFNHPIRQIMAATSLRSSAWNRGATSKAILDDDKTGRSNILIFQLQGHVSSIKKDVISTFVFLCRPNAHRPFHMCIHSFSSGTWRN